MREFLSGEFSYRVVNWACFIVFEHGKAIEVVSYNVIDDTLSSPPSTLYVCVCVCV